MRWFLGCFGVVFIFLCLDKLDKEQGGAYRKLPPQKIFRRLNHEN